MYLRSVLAVLLLAVTFTACNKEKEEPKPAAVTADLPAGFRQVIVKEVVQVSEYTYLRVSEGSGEFWMAINKADVKVGDAVRFSKFMEMTNFKSTELNRTFASILFVQDAGPAPTGKETPGGANTPQKPTIAKENVSVEKAAGGITIAELYAKLKSYENKTVKIRGKITKLNTGIMDRSWAHIQDGTGSGEEFDLTVTTQDAVNLGDVVTFQGKIVLNKDFGYGYTYKVLLEDAKASK